MIFLTIKNASNRNKFWDCCCFYFVKVAALSTQVCLSTFGISNNNNVVCKLICYCKMLILYKLPGPSRYRDLQIYCRYQTEATFFGGFTTDSTFISRYNTVRGIISIFFNSVYSGTDISAFAKMDLPTTLMRYF